MKVAPFRLAVVALLAATASAMAGCQAIPGSPQVPADVATVYAVVETEPVRNPGDAADDPAIWIHPDDPAQSTVIGTDKQGALAVYDLTGAALHRYPDGKHNNVDVRYGFQIGDRTADLVVSSDAEAREIRVYAVDTASRGLVDVGARRSQLPFEPYGLCLYESDVDGSLHAFVTGADEGILQQWTLFDGGEWRVGLRRVRDLSLASQAEGCVADDAAGALYVAEDGVGIWRYEAEPGDRPDGVLLERVVPEGGEHLVPDIEGLAMYHTAEGSRYLLASSQGNSTFVVYDLNPFSHAGTFVIGAGEVDEVTETDGIDVTSVPLGEPFEAGLFVAQDDRNDGENQNFKLVPWEHIAQAHGLVIDTSWSPRSTSP